MRQEYIVKDVNFETDVTNRTTTTVTLRFVGEKLASREVAKLKAALRRPRSVLITLVPVKTKHRPLR